MEQYQEKITKKSLKDADKVMEDFGMPEAKRKLTLEQQFKCQRSLDLAVRRAICKWIEEDEEESASATTAEAV